MKKYIIRYSITKYLGIALFALMAISFNSCKEEIDESNFAVKEDQTAWDLVSSTDSLSSIKSIFERVRLGNSDNASSLASVLSARGNYTVFAPTNTALKTYVESLGLDSIDKLTYEQAQLIAYSCIIDNGDLDAYETADFPGNSEAFSISNLNDRMLTTAQDSLADWVVNGIAKVINPDNEVSNGMVHVVGGVIVMSSDMICDMIYDTPNMKIMGRLFRETGLANLLVEDRDEAYEEVDRADELQFNGIPGKFEVVKKRYLGYTAFVETDDVMLNWLGLTESDKILDEDGNLTDSSWNTILGKLKEKFGYAAASNPDLTDTTDPLNMFASYHFLEGKIAPGHLVAHYNEYGYQYGSDKTNPQKLRYPVDVWDYYSTISPNRRLLKVTQVEDKVSDEHPLYINRFCEYDVDNAYNELSVYNEGVEILQENGSYDTKAANGYIYPIKDVLLYSTAIREYLGSERMRVDISTMLPELMSNNRRGYKYTYFPHSYFNNMTKESTDTQILYLTDAYSPGGGNWRDFQGDEILLLGTYDVTLKLPPVPVEGTYELRMGISMNPLRGMAQIYFGTDPDRLSPAGLPVDMRQSASNNPAIPWVADVEDDAINAENDKNLRNQGYMKAPMYFCVTNGQGDQPCRLVEDLGLMPIRRIVTTAQMSPDQSYYFRFKSALKKTDAQFFLDYFEIVPTSVYNNTAKPEDIW